MIILYCENCPSIWAKSLHPELRQIQKYALCFFSSCANYVGRKHFYLMQQSPMHTLIYLMQDQSRQRKAEIFRELEVRQSIFYSFQPPFSAFSAATKIQ